MTVTTPAGQTSSASFDFSNNCSGISPQGPFDLSSLFAPGANHVEVALSDRCGGDVGNTSVYLVGDDTFSAQR